MENFILTPNRDCLVLFPDAFPEPLPPALPPFGAPNGAGAGGAVWKVCPDLAAANKAWIFNLFFSFWAFLFVFLPLGSSPLTGEEFSSSVALVVLTGDDIMWDFTLMTAVPQVSAGLQDIFEGGRPVV